MYHLTADSEVVFFFALLCGMGCRHIFGGGGVGRRYSVGLNLGWGDIEIPVGFWGSPGFVGCGGGVGLLLVRQFFHLIFLFLLAFLFAFAFAVLALLLSVFAFVFTCAFLFALLSGLVAFLDSFVAFLFGFVTFLLCLVALLNGLVAFLLCLVALLGGLVAFLLCLVALFDSVFTFFVYFFTFLGSTSLLLTLLCGGGLCTNSCYAHQSHQKCHHHFFHNLQSI